MRARSSIAIATATWLALVAGACSLNPQPLPPETANQDGSAGDTTSSDGGAHDSASFGDAGNTRDGGPFPPPNDAASDAPIGPRDGGDAASDASADAPDGD